MYCSNCGAKLEEAAHFCLNCGVKTTAGEYGARGNSSTYSHDGAKQKSKFVAGVLAVILGTLGIHNFYLGYTSKGVAQLLLFVFWFGWISFIWGIVEAVMIFTDRIDRDAYGVSLSDNI